MGQYYKAYIKRHDRKPEVLSPRDYGDGSKITEHSWFGNFFVNAAISRIENNPAVLAWVGDYANDVGCIKSVYNACWDTSENLYEVKVYDKFLFKNLITGGVTAEGFFINHWKKEFIDVCKYIEILFTDYKNYDASPYAMCPLPLLTAIGNGQGGGDYYSTNINFEQVGRWALDEIEFKRSDPPKGYEDVTEICIFNE